MDVLGDEIASKFLHETLSVVRVPLDSLMSRLVEMGFSPNTQASAFAFAVSLFVMQYNEYHSQSLTQAECIGMAQADTLSHPVVSKWIAGNVGEAIDRKVTG